MLFDDLIILHEGNFFDLQCIASDFKCDKMLSVQRLMNKSLFDNITNFRSELI